MAVLALISGLSLAWALAGIAAVGLPVVAHLMSRRGGPTIVFPAVRFIQQAAAEYARRYRLRDLLLLMMRAVIVVLIALSFDRPVWRTDTASGPTDPNRDVVVVLDVSASMTRTSGGRVMFETARDRAIEAITALDPALHRAGVVLAGHSARPLLPRLTSNLDALVRELAEVQSTFEHADLAAALAAAASLDMPTSDEAPREREVLVISDLQRTQWAGLSIPARLTLRIHQVGSQATTDNLALSELRLDPSRPIAGQPVTISVVVSNFGDAPKSPMVMLETPDARMESAPSLGAQGRSRVSFETRFLTAGEQLVTASIIDEGFVIDDTARLVAPVRDARRIAMLTRSSSDDPATFAYYLGAALAPTADAGIEVESLVPELQSVQRLEMYDGVILAEAGRPDEPTLRAVMSYLTDGGGVLWFVDSEEAHASLSGFASEKEQGVLLPVRPVDRFVRLPTGQSIGLAQADFASPVLKLFDGPAGRTLLGSRYRSIAPAVSQAHGVTFAQFETAEPFLAWGQVGTGRVLMVLACLTPGDADLVKSPLFPPLVHELLGFATPTRPSAPVPYVGTGISALLNDETEPVQPVRDNLGRAVRVTRAQGGGGWLLLGESAPQPGFVEFADGAGNVLATRSVALDPAESDLRSIDPDDLRNSIESEQQGLAIVERSELSKRREIELWPGLIAAVLVLLALENVVACWSIGSRFESGEA